MTRTIKQDSLSAWLYIFVFYLFLVGSKLLLVLITTRSRHFLSDKPYLYGIRLLGLLLLLFAAFLFYDALIMLI